MPPSSQSDLGTVSYCLLERTEKLRAKKEHGNFNPVLFFLDSALGRQGLKPIAYCSAGLATVQATPAVS